jgi:hypothetical protein
MELKNTKGTKNKSMSKSIFFNEKNSMSFCPYFFLRFWMFLCMGS